MGERCHAWRPLAVAMGVAAAVLAAGGASPPRDAVLPIVVEVCNASAPAQHWNVDEGWILLAASSTTTAPMCVGWAVSGPVSQDPLELDACRFSTRHESTGGEVRPRRGAEPDDDDARAGRANDATNQAFTFDAATAELIVSAGSREAGLLIDVSVYGSNGPGSIVWVDNSTGKPNQKWSLKPVQVQAASNAVAVLLVSQQTAWKRDQLCLAVGAPAPPPPPPPPPTPPPITFDWLDPCRGLNLTAFPWCDMTETPTYRAASLVAAMTLEEKSRTLVPFAPPIGRLRLPPLYTTDALHGAFSSPHYQCVPIPPPAHGFFE